ncbi:putative arylsulfatase B precursor [Ixodes scapularis]
MSQAVVRRRTSHKPLAEATGPDNANGMIPQRFSLVNIAAIGVAILLFFALAAMLLASRRSPVRQPHIVFILADDMGWNDVSYNGCPQIRTPNIDALAWNGIRLQRYYTQHMCTPSRAALMTGRYPIHTGMQHFVILQMEPRGLPLKFKLLPQWLGDLGYVSQMLGKWHLGFYKKEYTPTMRGFQKHIGSWGTFVDYYSHPLFLYLAHLAPHVANRNDPLQAPKKYSDKYHDIGHWNRTLYAGMVSALDESVGAVVEALGKRGMLSDTVLVFSSDNGGDTNGENPNYASSWPFKGQKRTLWEGGIHVPGFIWSPLFSGMRGFDYNNIFHISDWLPTLYQLAGE